MNIKRNTIVIAKGGTMYGRVWRTIDEAHVQVIDCGKNIRIYRISDLEVPNYKGTWEFGRHPGNLDGKPPVWVKMTSLRRLKKISRDYNPHFGGKNFLGRPWTKEETTKALANRDISIPRGLNQCQTT